MAAAAKASPNRRIATREKRRRHEQPGQDARAHRRSRRARGLSAVGGAHRRRRVGAETQSNRARLSRPRAIRRRFARPPRRRRRPASRRSARRRAPGGGRARKNKPSASARPTPGAREPGGGQRGIEREPMRPPLQRVGVGERQQQQAERGDRLGRHAQKPRGDHLARGDRRGEQEIEVAALIEQARDADESCWRSSKGARTAFPNASPRRESSAPSAPVS